MKEMTVTNYSCFYNQNSFEFFMKLCSINTCIMSINPYMTGNVSSCLKSRLGTYYSCASQSQLHPQQCVWPNLLGTKIQFVDNYLKITRKPKTTVQYYLSAHFTEKEFNLYYLIKNQLIVYVAGHQHMQYWVLKVIDSEQI